MNNKGKKEPLLKSIIIMRHGERIDCNDSLKNNQELSEYDPELTEKGIKQAKDIGNQIKKSIKKEIHTLNIYTSPFTRTIMTGINLAQKLKSTAENLNISSKQLNDANKTIIRLDDDLNQAEKELAKAKNDLNSLNNMLTNEKRIKEEIQEKANQLELDMKEKIDVIKDLNNEIISLNSNIEILNKDKERSNNEIDKYKAHIMFLTETNQKLMNELEAVAERDQQMKILMEQGDDLQNIINKTRDDIDNALNNLEIGLTNQK